MSRYFFYDARLTIRLPALPGEWDDLPPDAQAEILHGWEQIRGGIPDAIKRFEHRITAKQQRLNEEEDFAVSCRLNSEIADLASRINDLQIWFRVDEEITGKPHSG